MKGLLLCWVVVPCILPAVVGGQNLVPNPSFESFTQCPDANNQIDRCTDWSAFRRTPDYFNSCDVSETVGVPQNSVGYQSASSGTSYAGVSTYSAVTANGAREYIGAQLTQPLQVGVPISLSLKLSPAGFVQNANESMRWTASGIGVRFCMEPFFENTGPLPNSAALYLSTVPSDTIIWLQLHGYYVPDSAYEYIVVGNFFADSLTSIAILDSSGLNPYAYAYVDDLCVSLDLNGCDANSVVVDPVGLVKAWAYPNPFVNEMMFDLPFGTMLPLRIAFHDALGRLVYSHETSNKEFKLSWTDEILPVGTYLVTITSSEGINDSRIVVRVEP